MRIQVTAEDITRGRMQSAHFCPVAMAIKRATSRMGCEVAVAPVTVRVSPGPVAILPDEAQAFVRAFDNGAPAEPFEFDLPGENE